MENAEVSRDIFRLLMAKFFSPLSLYRCLSLCRFTREFVLRTFSEQQVIYIKTEALKHFINKRCQKVSGPSTILNLYLLSEKLKRDLKVAQMHVCMPVKHSLRQYYDLCKLEVPIAFLEIHRKKCRSACLGCGLLISFKKLHKHHNHCSKFRLK